MTNRRGAAAIGREGVEETISVVVQGECWGSRIGCFVFDIVWSVVSVFFFFFGGEMEVFAHRNYLLTRFFAYIGLTVRLFYFHMERARVP